MILSAEADKEAAILRAQGEGQAIMTVFESIHRGDPDQPLLAYQYLQMLPKIAEGQSNTLVDRAVGDRQGARGARLGRVPTGRRGRDGRRRHRGRDGNSDRVTPLEIGAVAVAGLLAGTINTIVGSGTLITFPVLVALGVPPVTANASNSLGLVPGADVGRLRLPPTAGRPGTAAGASPARLAQPGPWWARCSSSCLPKSAFAVIVPFLIALAVVLVAAGPWLVRLHPS